MEIDAVSYLKFLLSLLFVLGLIGGAALLAKRAGLGHRGPIVKGQSKRLAIIESMSLDPKRRVFLIRRDDKEHLILLGGAGEQVIESGLDIDDEITAAEQAARLPKAFRNPLKAVG